jgi:hypothetical protein
MIWNEESDHDRADKLYEMGKGQSPPAVSPRGSSPRRTTGFDIPEPPSAPESSAWRHLPSYKITFPIYSSSIEKILPWQITK